MRSNTEVMPVLAFDWRGMLMVSIIILLVKMIISFVINWLTTIMINAHCGEPHVANGLTTTAVSLLQEERDGNNTGGQTNHDVGLSTRAHSTSSPVEVNPISHRRAFKAGCPKPFTVELRREKPTQSATLQPSKESWYLSKVILGLPFAFPPSGSTFVGVAGYSSQTNLDSSSINGYISMIHEIQK